MIRDQMKITKEEEKKSYAYKRMIHLVQGR